jgi:adenylosuccinate lyase
MELLEPDPMEDNLYCISPVDGRYSKLSAPLRAYFSEFALFRYRLLVEIEYLKSLAQLGINHLPPFEQQTQDALDSLYKNFSLEDASRIKQLEKVTNHDIKALEYFIKEKLEVNLGPAVEWVHFGLTSQDINNTAVPLSLKDANSQVLLPAIRQLVDKITQMALTWKLIPMLARTHGQPASPTSLGKEIYVFAERLGIQTEALENQVWAAKFGGATGNFNAHHAAFPEIDWPEFADRFINSLGLKRSRTTTQIEHYDHLASWCHNLCRINTILIDLCRDIWMYISMDYFTQKLQKGETGSSAMPHKVNPIDFENAEGNLGISNALLIHFAEKLPISRLQRDLSDSTVLRNLGVPIAHSLIALRSISKGLDKLILNETALKNDLQKHTAVLAEGIQTILRREGYPKPYEALKDLTRGNQQIDLQAIHRFIDQLEINEQLKIELKSLRPETYTGVIRF